MRSAVRNFPARAPTRVAAMWARWVKAITRMAASAVAAQFAKFDAATAECFLAKDREKLFAVIEAGFGDLIEFKRVQGAKTEEAAASKQSRLSS